MTQAGIDTEAGVLESGSLLGAAVTDGTLSESKVAVAEGTVPLASVQDARVMLMPDLGLTSIDMEEKLPEEKDCTLALREGKRCALAFDDEDELDENEAVPI